MFNDVLINLRKENNISQNDLAKYLKVSQAQISRYENGTNEPDILTLKILANYFNVSVDYLIGNTNIKSEKDLLDRLDIQLKEIKAQFKEIIRNK